MLDVHPYTWFATIGALLLLLGYDLWIAHRKGPHVITPGEATRWVLFYVTLAIAFGAGLWFFGGHQAGAEFFAGYITEYSLSVDNLFVFVIIMATFKVPAAFQHKVLLFGIVLALALRGVFIAVGAAAIERFVFTFFIFGAFLVFTAYKLATAHDQEGESESNAFVKLMERVLPTTPDYDEAKVLTRVDGKRVVTPMLLVMIAIGSTDLLFALDSIPAIFGLTQEAYIVFTANAFALMGLRQLYFLLDGLLDRLVYLSKGLAIILGFIGLKLIFHAAHEYSWGKSWAPDIGTFTSLGVIIAVLAVTVVASLAKTKRDPSAAKSLPKLDA
ncbi:MAG: rane protein TerC, involved in tellurium resistance [Frankiales bacterium]|nr:rane protein TerC, involved in tellurium resistance [Frankiales bacterium]